MPRGKRKAAVKKTGAKKTTMSKADFVRSLPSDTPAKDVVVKAKAAGITLNEMTVYKTRSLDKAAGKRKAKKAGVSKPGPKPKSPVSQHLEHVRALRGVILHVGIDRAKEMMDQIVKDLMVMAD